MLDHHLRRWPNIEAAGQTFLVVFLLGGGGADQVPADKGALYPIEHEPNVGLMSVQRLRRWPDIKPTSGLEHCIHWVLALSDVMIYALRRRLEPIIRFEIALHI